MSATRPSWLVEQRTRGFAPPPRDGFAFSLAVSALHYITLAWHPRVTPVKVP